MKYLYSLFFISILLVSCKSSFPEGKNFSITLNLDSTLASTQQKIYLFYAEGNQEDLIDSILTDGKKQNFTFYGYAPYQDEYSLIFEREGPQRLGFIVTPKDRLNINFTENDYKGYGVSIIDIVDNKPQHEYYLYSMKNDSLRLKKAYYEKELKKNSTTQKTALQDSIENCERGIKELYQQLLHSDSPFLADFSIIFFKIDYGGIEPYKDYLLKKFPNYTPIKRGLGILKTAPETEHSKLISKKVNNIYRNRFVRFEKKEQDREPKLDSLNLILHDENGKQVNLNAFRGKYVLVDFWASWCKPCLVSMPKLLEVKNKFDKEFEICAISLDKSKILWKKAIQKHKLSSFHHYIGIDNNGKIYKDIEDLGFTSIPQNYLLDRNGKVLGTNLSTEEIIEKLNHISKS